MAKRQFVKKKRISGVQKNFRKWAEWDEGDFVIGKFVGIHNDQYDKENMIMEVIDAGFRKAKEAKAIVGKNLVLNAAGQLTKAMEQLSEGDIIQVTYGGTATIEKGKYKGKDAHVLEIDQLEDENGEEEDNGEEDEEDEEDCEDEDEEVDL